MIHFVDEEDYILYQDIYRSLEKRYQYDGRLALLDYDISNILRAHFGQQPGFDSLPLWRIIYHLEPRERYPHKVLNLLWDHILYTLNHND